MRRITLGLLTTTALVGLTAGAATAADLPRKAPPPVVAPPPPLWNWTGFYVGGNVGPGWSRQQFGNENSDFGSFNNTNAGFGSQTGVGPTGGFQVGYNWQFANSPIVVGLEGMFNFANIRANSNSSFSNGPVNTSALGASDTFTTRTTHFNSQFSSKVKDIALLTARLGLASGPQDRTLWYVKGGGAWAKANYTLNTRTTVTDSFIDFDPFLGECPGQVVCFGTTTTNSFNSLQQSRSRWGWTAGTGVEFGLWGNWSTRIEYDYLRFNNNNINNNFNVTNFCLAGNCGVKSEIHLVTIGLNYRFDWGNWGKAPRAY
jgi:outer membrane immunogenic protein